MNLYMHKTSFGQFVLIEQDSISNTIKSTGRWEPWLTHLYQKFIKTDFTCVDVGANIGWHTVNIGNLCKDGITYAFEPQSDIYNILSSNILFNNLSANVLHFREALGDKNEKMQFNKLSDCAEKNSNLVNWGGRKIVPTGEGEGLIETKTLDSFKLDKVDFIKLDVEGFEIKFLKGSTNTIKSNLPIIFFENYAWHDDYVDDKKVIKKLKSYGYSIFRILVTSYKEDCIALHPDKHLEEIEYLKQQKDIPFSEE